VPLLGLEISESLNSDYYITEKNGLMDDIYSQYENNNYEECLAIFDSLLKREEPKWGDKRIIIEVLMCKDVFFDNNNGEGRVYVENEIYKIGAKRASILISKGIAKRV
jgi:transcription elongation factor GreA-like protein